MINAQKIRELRKGKGVSREDVAAAVYASASMITYIELGAKKPGVELLKRIADYFGVTMDELCKDSREAM